MKAYLGGKMRGIKDYNFPAFHAAAADLRERGWEVASPAERDESSGFDPTLNTLDGFDLQSAMRWDLQQVLASDAIIVLPGWETSHGAGVEVLVARESGRAVLAYPDLTPIPDGEGIA